MMKMNVDRDKFDREREREKEIASIIIHAEQLGIVRYLTEFMYNRWKDAGFASL